MVLSVVDDAGANAAYPALRRLLGTMTGDWRAVDASVVAFLSAKAVSGELPGGAEGVVTELDELLGAATSEFHYVQVVIESGANFSPYGEFHTAGEFLRALRSRLADPRGARGAAAEGAAAGDGGAGRPAATAARADLADAAPSERPLLRRLLRTLWSGWRDASDDVDVVEHLGAAVRDLIDLAGVPPVAILAEIDQLLQAGWSHADHVSFLAETGAYDVGSGDAETFWQQLRDHVAELAERHPRPEADPKTVTEATLAALDHGQFGRAMTGLVRRYGLPALRGGDLPHFRATVSALLDRVLPQWVERYVDALCYAAQSVADDIDWTRVRWMRSAVELLLTEYARTDAAAFVDTDQVGLVDGLLAAPTCRFRLARGAPVPQLPDSHWWWAGQEGHPERDGVARVGHPAHLRWYRGWSAWQARPARSHDESLTPVAVARELSARMIRAGLVGFAGLLQPRAASVTVQVLDAGGTAIWSARSLPARTLGDRLVVDDADLTAAPPGERVISSATVRGRVGDVTASWSAELIRTCHGAEEMTRWGWATLVVDGGLSTADDATLGTALKTWEEELAAEVTDWSSAATPTLIGRYGSARETFAHDPPRPHPLLIGISRHFWDGELLLGLAGVARVYAAHLFDEVDRRPWETDWVAALRYLGADGWDEFIGRLVHWTRELAADDWYLLCAARSGLQFVAEELAGDQLAALIRQDRVATLDDAMRTFGHPFGPIPLTSVPSRLHRRHKWWRYPAGPSEADDPPTLQALVVELRAELDRPEQDRSTKAPADALRRILAGCERVLDGTLPGFRGADAATVNRLVADGWNAAATLTGRLRGYFQPIEHHAESWALPPGGTAG